MAAPQRKIEVVPYDPTWAELFEAEAARLSEAIPEGLVAVHHIGSTSVPGLAAKPTIDILAEVSDLTVLDRFDSNMESLGYLAKGEFGIPGRRFYLKGLIDRTHHVHAFEQGSVGLHRHLAVRDYLRAHIEQVAEYGSLKLQIAKQFEHDSDGYCDAKHDYVQALERRALRWKSRSPQATESDPAKTEIEQSEGDSERSFTGDF